MVLLTKHVLNEQDAQGNWLECQLNFAHIKSRSFGSSLITHNPVFKSEWQHSSKA